LFKLKIGLVEDWRQRTYLGSPAFVSVRVKFSARLRSKSKNAVGLLQSEQRMNVVVATETTHLRREQAYMQAWAVFDKERVPDVAVLAEYYLTTQ